MRVVVDGERVVVQFDAVKSFNTGESLKVGALPIGVGLVILRDVLDTLHACSVPNLERRVLSNIVLEFATVLTGCTQIPKVFLFLPYHLLPEFFKGVNNWLRGSIFTEISEPRLRSP